jgi:hypothetical protein
MPQRIAPSLRIELSKDERCLRIEQADGEVHEVPWNVESGKAKEYRKDIRDGLLDMKAALGGRHDALTIEKASTAMEFVNKRGVSLLPRFFGRANVDKVIEIFQKSLPSWRLGTEPVRITSVARLDQLFPLEFLPLFNPDEWTVADDYETFAESVRRFPAFSAIVRREFPDLTINQNLILENEPKLSVRCFYDERLKGAADEVKFFQDNTAYIDLDGPWPNQFPQKEFPKAIAGHIKYANRSFVSDEPRPTVDHVQHFTCHCETNEDVTRNSELELSEKNKVTIVDLDYWFFLMKENGPSLPPLIFLNACGSGTTIPMTVASFPHFFLHENGNRGFIGTEINVTDDFASRFSKAFYTGLLQGLNLGSAIHSAKWKLLKEMHNPLGIIYTVYADPDLHVKIPVEIKTGQTEVA